MGNIQFTMIPTGNLQNILTIVGAVAGILIGLITGYFSVYSNMNKSNNFSMDGKLDVQKKNEKFPMIFTSVVFFAFGGAVIAAAFLSEEIASIRGTALVLASLFVGGGVLMAVTAFKQKKE